MTVKELITWLSTQDSEAIVQVVKHTQGRGWDDQGGNASIVDFTPELSEFTDFRGNPYVEPTANYYNQRYLLLGEKDG